MGGIMLCLSGDPGEVTVPSMSRRWFAICMPVGTGYGIDWSKSF
jgi:hypothetical protein